MRTKNTIKISCFGCVGWIWCDYDTRVDRRTIASTTHLSLITFTLCRLRFVLSFASVQVALMDAGHLKGSWKGVMYVLSAKDSNNRIVHVSTVLADKENETNYRFGKSEI